MGPTAWAEQGNTKFSAPIYESAPMYQWAIQSKGPIGPTAWEG